ncbi:MAG TPA: DUF998 domain-containing protein [Burkholderiales bacterium]|nr:DUF998 domain-containing protein [Burkholderiales bacterium]
MRLGIRALAAFVIAAVVYWTAVMLAMHALETQFNPLRAPMSAYVLGGHGVWVTTTYFVLSASLLCVGYCMLRTLPRTRLTSTAFVFCAVATIGAALAGSFPMDFPGPPFTLSGRLHAAGGVLTFFPWVLGTLSFTLALRTDPRWQGVSGWLTALAAGVAVALAVLIFSVRILGYAGGAQRLLVVLLFAWMILAVYRVIRLSAGGGAAEQRVEANA